MARDDVGRAGARERRTATYQLVQDTAKRIEIGAAIDGAGAATLLGRHVARRPEDRAGPRDRVIRTAAAMLGKPAIDQLDLLPGAGFPARDQKDVRRFEIAMHDAAVMNNAEYARHRASDPQR